MLLENVSHLAAHNAGLTLQHITALLEAHGYAVSWTILNARHFALPQQRRRIFIAAVLPEYAPVNWPRLRRPCPSLDTILETDLPRRYYATAAVRTKARERLKSPATRPSIWHTNRSGHVTPRPYSAALRADGSHNYLLVDGERRLTEREMLRLQGFPEDFRRHGSYTQARRHIGNAVAVPVAAAALRSVKHEARDRIRRLADALYRRNGVWQAYEDIIEMSAACGAELKRMLEATPRTDAVEPESPPNQERLIR